jgi:hypothetical protein
METLAPSWDGFALFALLLEVLLNTTNDQMIYKFYNGEIDSDELTEKEVKEKLCTLQGRTKIRIYDWKKKNGIWHFIKIETCRLSDIFNTE